MAEAVQKIDEDTLVKLLAQRKIPIGGRRLRQLAREGFFPEPQRSQYHFLPTLLGLIEHYHGLFRKHGGELDIERLRKLKEEADKLALENEKTRGGLVEIEVVYKWAEAVFVGIRQKILASRLDQHEQDDILADMRQLKARRLSKSNRPGEHPQPALRHPDAAAEA